MAEHSGTHYSGGGHHRNHYRSHGHGSVASHVVIEGNDHSHGHSHGIVTSHATATHVSYPAPAPSTSSLALAAGSRPVPVGSPVQMKVVIGGERSQKCPSPPMLGPDHDCGDRDDMEEEQDLEYAHNVKATSHATAFPHRVVIGGQSQEEKEVRGLGLSSQYPPQQQEQVQHFDPLLPQPQEQQFDPSTQHDRTAYALPVPWGRNLTDASDSMNGVRPQRLQQEEEHNVTIERMEVEDIIPMAPLIVLDGANVAYAYGNALCGSNSNEADVEGIGIASHYFLSAGCRVQVVLPAQWLREKSNRYSSSSGRVEITPQMDALFGLKEQGMLCAAPPNDDDDAYAIMLARREDGRAARRRGGGQSKSSTSASDKNTNIIARGGGFVLSNDKFRDAQSRDIHSSDPTGLREWLEGDSRKLSDVLSLCPGRISYSFGDIGSIDKFGDPKLDLVPNPRHPLVAQIEREYRAKELSLA